MKEVTTAPAGLGRPRTTALDRLRMIALATVLACTASGAHANFASVVIQGLFVSGSSSPEMFLFAPTDTRNQAWDLQAWVNGVTVDQDANSVPNWTPADATAQGPETLATMSSAVNTDPLTQLETPRFTLAATANSTNGHFTALGNMLTSGSFCFWDSLAPTPPDFDGTSAFCNGAGSLTFTLFYDLIVNANSPNTAYAELNVLGTGVPGGFFFDFASTALGIPSRLDQSFSWTANVGAGDSAFFDLAGIVVAEDVPEPGVLSLVALGLLGLFVTRRRHGARAAA